MRGSVLSNYKGYQREYILYSYVPVIITLGIAKNFGWGDPAMILKLIVWTRIILYLNERHEVGLYVHY
jgi:hypothetical protein